MQKVSEYKLYELAVAVHPLAAILGAVKYSVVWLDWWSARTAIQNLFQQRQLEFCFDVANRLYYAISAVVPVKWEDATGKIGTVGDPEPDVAWHLVHNIAEAAKEFETVLKTELNNADTYFIDPKGTHKTSVLMTDASREIPAAILSAVSNEVKEDFNQAGRCLLFESSTAVGFHLMRAIESTVYTYLKKLSGKDIPVKSRNWGVYIKALEKLAGDKKVIGTIQHIKDTYRNPILHPEVTLSPDEAQVLFGLSVSAIVQIVTAMKTAKGMALAFPTAGPVALP